MTPRPMSGSTSTSHPSSPGDPGVALPGGSVGARATSWAGSTFSIQNLERGQVIEVTAHGSMAGAAAGDFADRVMRLIAAREPHELRIDLDDTSGDIGLAASLADASAALWTIGSHLVVAHPSSALRQLLLDDDAQLVVEPALG